MKIWKPILHLVVKDLRFTRLGFGDQRILKDVENILAHFLQLRLNLLAVVADGANMFIDSPGLLLLFDGRNYAPRSTTCANHVLVSYRQKVPLIDR